MRVAQLTLNADNYKGGVGMKIIEIDRLTIKDTMPAEIQYIRKKGPALLASIINDTKIFSPLKLDNFQPEYIHALNEGVDSATYLVITDGQQYIVKFGFKGLAMEVETIRNWRIHNVSVPKIIKFGTVPATINDNKPIEFLVQAALVDSDGRLVETCANLLARDPAKARQVGQQMGVQLSLIHSSVSRHKFGELLTRSKKYTTWNEYLIDCIKKESNYLDSIGIDKKLQAKIIDHARSHDFVKRGRYLHGDFSIRNIAVKNYQPLKLAVFDPNPIIGDPVWDLSFPFNNYEYAKRRLTTDDPQTRLYKQYRQILIGFRQCYKRQIDFEGLHYAQLIQAIYQSRHSLKIKDKIGYQIRKEFISDLTSQIISN